MKLLLKNIFLSSFLLLGPRAFAVQNEAQVTPTHDHAENSSAIVENPPSNSQITQVLWASVVAKLPPNIQNIFYAAYEFLGSEGWDFGDLPCNIDTMYNAEQTAQQAIDKVIKNTGGTNLVKEIATRTKTITTLESLLYPTLDAILCKVPENALVVLMNSYDQRFNHSWLHLLATSTGGFETFKAQVERSEIFSDCKKYLMLAAIHFLKENSKCSYKEMLETRFANGIKSTLERFYARKQFLNKRLYRLAIPYYYSTPFSFSSPSTFSKSGFELLEKRLRDNEIMTLKQLCQLCCIYEDGGLAFYGKEGLWPTASSQQEQACEIYEDLINHFYNLPDLHLKSGKEQFLKTHPEIYVAFINLARLYQIIPTRTRLLGENSSEILIRHAAQNNDPLAQMLLFDIDIARRRLL